MEIERAYQRFIGRDVVVYLYLYETTEEIQCVLDEVGDGWIKVTQDDASESIIPTEKIMRIRTHPIGKNGKKKTVFI